MNLWVLLSVLAALAGLRFLRPQALGWIAAWWIALYLILSFGVEPPLPASIIGMFMTITTLALLAYLSSNSQSLAEAVDAVVRFMVDDKHFIHLIAVVVALPALVALKVYIDASQPVEPPISSRTIHPPPPASIAFKGEKVDLITASNPYRELAERDPEGFRRHLDNGRRVYHQNCVFCHGDNMEGKGLFAHSFDPIPANFSDPTTIAMLQESYLFWRIAKGAPGLPEESMPWNSAMPAWETFLSAEEIWDVILFLYDFTGQKPRAQEAVH